MRRALLVALLLASCSSPDGDVAEECGPNGACPAGFTCNPVDRRCYPSGAVAGSDAGAAPADAAGAADARPSPDAPAAPDAAGLPPVTVILTRPAARTRTAGATFTFGGGATYRCRLDAAAFAACPETEAITVSEGAHVLEVFAVSESGLADPTPESHRWEVDLTGPTVEIAGPDEGGTSGRDVTFGLTTEAGASLRCALDSTTLAPCAASVALAGLPGGGHVLRAQASDDLGNVGPPAARTWTVDAAGPTVQIAPLPGDVSDPSGTIGYTASEPGATFECKLDGGSFGACAASGFPLSGLAVSGHKLAVRATDRNHNTGGETVYSLTVLGGVDVVVEHLGARIAGATIVSQRASVFASF